MDFKDIINNERGHLVLGLLSLSLSLLITFLIFSFYRYQKIWSKDLKETLLCFSKQSQIIASQYEKQILINKVVSSSFHLQYSPVPAVASVARTTHNAAKLSQEVMAKKYFIETMANQYCHALNKTQSLKAYPFENKFNLLLSRNFDGTVVEKKQWNLRIISSRLKIIINALYSKKYGGELIVKRGIKDWESQVNPSSLLSLSLGY